MHNNTLNFFIKKHLFIKKIQGRIYIYCMIRNKFLLLKKEEIIRQYIIFLLKKIKNYKTSNILVEYHFHIDKLSYIKPDILVHINHKPHILIECKSPMIDITQKTFDQIFIYNKIIKSPYLMISNGIKNFILKKKIKK